MTDGNDWFKHTPAFLDYSYDLTEIEVNKFREYKYKPESEIKMDEEKQKFDNV